MNQNKIPTKNKLREAYCQGLIDRTVALGMLSVEIHGISPDDFRDVVALNELEIKGSTVDWNGSMYRQRTLRRESQHNVDTIVHDLSEKLLKATGELRSECASVQITEEISPAVAERFREQGYTCTPCGKGQLTDLMVIKYDFGDLPAIAEKEPEPEPEPSAPDVPRTSRFVSTGSNLLVDFPPTCDKLRFALGTTHYGKHIVTCNDTGYDIMHRQVIRINGHDATSLSHEQVIELIRRHKPTGLTLILG